MGELGTGVEIRLIDDPMAWVDSVYDDVLEARRLRAAVAQGELLLVEKQVFVEVGDGERWGGVVTSGDELILAEDVTNQLLAIASDAREQHLGDLLGDLRREGSTMTRWEFYAAPFRIELIGDLLDYARATNVGELRDLDIRRPDRLGAQRGGWVRWFDDERGYGRITADDGEVLFVHFSGIVAGGFRSLEAGQRVSFLWNGREADHGRHVAEDVRVESPAPPEPA